MDFSFCIPSEFYKGNDDVELLTKLYTEMITTDYHISEDLITPVSNTEYLNACGLDFFDN